MDILADDRYAALYLRVSSAGQLDNWSVKDQLGLSHLATPGRRVVVFDADLGISGETIEARPDMTRILKEVEAGRVAEILVVDWNRLSRDQDLVDGLRIKKACKDAGTLIKTPGKTYDFASDSDEMLSVFEQLFAANQNKARTKATTRGQYTKVHEGRWPGGALTFGYRVVYDVPHRDGRLRGRLEVDPAEADAVRRCYTLYADGHTDAEGRWRPLSFEGVARQLTAEGFRYRRRQSRDDRVDGKPPVTTAWGVMDVQRVVAGPQRRRYLGYELWGAGAGGVNRHARDIGAAEIAKPELRILDTALYLRAEAQRAKRRQEPARLGCPTYALQGLLRCPHCEGRTVANRRAVRSKGEVKKVTVDYACLRFRHYGATATLEDGGCPEGGYSVAEAVALGAVNAFLVGHLERRRVDEALDQAVADERARRDEGQVASLRAGLDDVALREGRLKEAVEAGIYTLAELRERKDALAAERERLQARLARLRAEARASGEVEEAVAQVRALGSVGKTLAVLAAADPARYRAFVGLLLEQVTVVASGPKRKREAVVVRPGWTETGRAWLGLDDAPGSTLDACAFPRLSRVQPLDAPFLSALAALSPRGDAGA
jgi:hypothetical protein